MINTDFGFSVLSLCWDIALIAFVDFEIPCLVYTWAIFQCPDTLKPFHSSMNIITPTRSNDSICVNTKQLDPIIFAA